jgi:alkyl hydroperoxide reductase subunit AhpF
MPVILIEEEITKQIRELFDNGLINPVELLFFSKNDQCNTCDETQQLLEEISSISKLVYLSTYVLDDSPDLAQQYNVQLAPCLVITSRDGDKLLDHGIRFTGIPSGYEFGTLIHDILIVSTRNSELKQETRKALQDLHVPIHLQVFVTPT